MISLKFEHFIDGMSGNLYITCFGSYTLYYNGTNIGTGNNTYTADPYFEYSLQPGDVIAFQGKVSSHNVHDHC